MSHAFLNVALVTFKTVHFFTDSDSLRWFGKLYGRLCVLGVAHLSLLFAECLLPVLLHHAIPSSVGKSDGRTGYTTTLQDHNLQHPCNASSSCWANLRWTLTISSYPMPETITAFLAQNPNSSVLSTSLPSPCSSLTINVCNEGLRPHILHYQTTTCEIF